MFVVNTTKGLVPPGKLYDAWAKNFLRSCTKFFHNKHRLFGKSDTRTNTVKTSFGKAKSHHDTSDKVGLKRNVGLVGAVSVIVGIMIGSGIFVSPKGVVGGSGSVGLSLVTWLIGGLLSLCGGLAYVELGTMIPKSGGDYSYMLAGLHPIVAFVYAFICTFVLRSASLPIIGLTSAHYMLSPFYNDGCGAAPEYIVKVLAFAIIILVTGINAYSTKLATKIQIVFTVAKVFALLLIIVGGFYNILRGVYEPLTHGFAGTNNNVGEIALGLYSSMWAYDGWSNLNFLMEEIQEPNKNLPRAIYIGVPLVAVMYILTNISYFTVLTPTDILNSEVVAVSWAKLVFPSMAWLVPLAVALSTFGSLNGCIMATGRMIYVAGREEHLVSLLSMIDVKHNTPSTAIWFTTIIGLLFTLPSDISSLIEIYSFSAWIFFGITFALLIYLRWKWPHKQRTFKCPLPCVFLALATSIYLVCAPIIQSPKVELLYSGLFVVIGLLLYFPFVHKKWKLPGIDHVTMWFQMFLQVSPTDPDVMKALLDGQL